MEFKTLEKFSLGTVAETVSNSDVLPSRSILSFAYGSMLDVSGKVQKVVKRGGEFRLVIESNVPGFTVFADCLGDAETVISRKIRKGSRVSIRGKLQSFGARAVCLFDCRITGKKQETRQKRHVHACAD